MHQTRPLPGQADPAPGAKSLAAESWQAIWRRMSPVERRAATTAYLAACAPVPMAAASADAVLARELRTRPAVVASWPLDRRADRLARLCRWDPPFLAAVIAAFHVECRRHLVTTFLDTLQLGHDLGVLRPVATMPEVPLERLAAAVAETRALFGDHELSLYLDALEAQQIPCFAALPTARLDCAALRADRR